MPAGTPVASIPHAAAAVPSILTAPLCLQMGAVGIAHGLPSEHRCGSWVTQGLILGRRDHKAHQLHLRMEAESAALKGSGILKTQPLFHQNHESGSLLECRDGEVPISITAHIGPPYSAMHGCAMTDPGAGDLQGPRSAPPGSPMEWGPTVHPHCPIGWGPTSPILVVQKHYKLPPQFLVCSARHRTSTV